MPAQKARVALQLIEESVRAREGNTDKAPSVQLVKRTQHLTAPTHGGRGDGRKQGEGDTFYPFFQKSVTATAENLRITRSNRILKAFDLAGLLGAPQPPPLELRSVREFHEEGTPLAHA